jgi:hypothetical protein
MKILMADSIAKSKLSMFQRSTQVVRHALEDVVKSTDTALLTGLTEILQSVEQDYYRGLVTQQLELYTTERRAISNKILGIIAGIVGLFTKVADLEPPKLDTMRDSSTTDQTRSTTANTNTTEDPDFGHPIGLMDTTEEALM